MRLYLLLAFCLPALLALFVIGCGDSGGNGNDGPRGNLSFTVINEVTLQPAAPTFIAFQDGPGGAWQPLTGSGVYQCQVTDPAGAYGIAVAVGDAFNVQLYVVQATLADATELTLPQYAYASGFTRASAGGPQDLAPARPLPAVRAVDEWTQQGAVSNIPYDFPCVAYADLYFSGFMGPVMGSFPYALRLPAGRPVDYGLLLGDLSDVPDLYALLYLRRGVTQAAGASVDADIDFSPPYDGSKSTYALTEQATVTVPGADGIETDWWPANGGSLYLHWSMGGSCTYPLIPAAAAAAGDSYAYRAWTTYKSVTCYSDAPLASISLPADFTCGLTADTLTYTGLTRAGTSLYSMTATDGQRSWMALATPGWLQAAGPTDYTLPDLSAVTGWQSAWTFTESAPFTDAYAGAYEFNSSLSTYLLGLLPPQMQGPRPDGTFVKRAGVTLYSSK